MVKRKYAVLGLGMMGEAIVYDLLTNDSNSIVFGFELIPKRRKEIDQKFKEYGERFRSYPLNLDVSVEFHNLELFGMIIKQKIHVVFGAIDYKYNVYLSRLCIEASAHFLDLGGNPNIVEKQRKLNGKAIENNITIIPDCGLAPGMANILAAAIMSKYEKLNSCKIRVGGLPQEPLGIMKYQQVFSIRGLTNEYLEDAEVIRDGKLINVPSLTELEDLEFTMFPSLPKLEAFQTAGGTSSLPVIFDGKIDQLDYKTIRYKGHCKFIQFLKEYDLLSDKKYKDTPARELVEHFLQKNLPKNKPDLVLIKIVVTGEINGKQTKTVYEILDKYDSKTGYSAMARTTAFPISIIGIMLAKSVITQKGVVPGELCVPYEMFMNELSIRNIIIKKSE